MISIKQRINIEMIRLAAMLALLFSILCNIVVIFNKFILYRTNFNIAIIELIKDFIIIYILNFVIFLGLSINRSVLYIGTVILFLTGAIASYYLYNFNIMVNVENIRIIFENDWQETAQILSNRLILWLLFCSLAGFGIIYYVNMTSTTTADGGLNKIVTIICLLFSAYNIMSPQYRIMTNYFPYRYLNGTYIYINDMLKKKPSKLDISNFPQSYHGADDLIIVLIIGESARADHFSLNGYERNTNPLLSKVANLSSFSGDSCSCMTYVSVPCMLTRATAANTELALRETSFISIFKKLGFTTNWFGTQSILNYLKNYSTSTLYDEIDNLILPGGNFLFKMNAHDEVLLPFMQEILKKPGKNLVILHTSGSHWHYQQRYPQNFTQFTPVCADQIIHKTDPSSCEIPALINSYDNSIIYTDYFINSVIASLNDKNAILIYAADHGQFLGENGRYMHAHTTVDAIEQYNIPILVWLSPKHKAADPLKYSNIQSHLDNRLSHDYIFHSMLDCSDIKSNIVDKRLSICQRRIELEKN